MSKPKKSTFYIYICMVDLVALAKTLNLLIINMKRLLAIISLFSVAALAIIIVSLLLQRSCFRPNVRLNTERMQLADSVILSAIDNGDMPGAVLCVVSRARDGESMGRTLYLKAYGNQQVISPSADGRIIPDTIPMSTDAIFDLASLSKCVGTTMAVMRLVEQGRLRLTDNVSQYIPDFKPWESKPAKRGEKIEREPITINHLLTHTSGLPAAIHVPTFMERYEKWGDPTTMNLRDSLITYLAAEAERRTRPSEVMLYSCLNFITLQAIIETITQQRLDHFLDQELFTPLKLKNTWYNHIDEPAPFDPSAPIAPTELQEDGSLLRGEVHDPTARIINRGVSGNAGVFSTAEDLAVIASMLMNEGVIRIPSDRLTDHITGGERLRLFSEATIDRFLELDSTLAHHGRTLGWAAGFFGDLGSRHSFNHTGYTGTSMAIDRRRGVAVILLSNRVHPHDKGSLARTRAVVSNIVASALD